MNEHLQYVLFYETAREDPRGYSSSYDTFDGAKESRISVKGPAGFSVDWHYSIEKQRVTINDKDYYWRNGRVFFCSFEGGSVKVYQGTSRSAEQPMTIVETEISKAVEAVASEFAPTSKAIKH